MKLFVWNEVDGVSKNYHDNGGILVIAASLDRAREMIAEKDGTKKTCDALTQEPDLTRDCEGNEYIAVHCNAGCC